MDQKKFDKEKYSQKSEIRIHQVAENIHEQFANLSANTGISISALLKPELPGILAKYPENMKVRRKLK